MTLTGLQLHRPMGAGAAVVRLAGLAAAEDLRPGRARRRIMLRWSGGGAGW